MREVGLPITRHEVIAGNCRYSCEHSPRNRQSGAKLTVGSANASNSFKCSSAVHNPPVIKYYQVVHRSAGHAEASLVRDTHGRRGLG